MIIKRVSGLKYDKTLIEVKAGEAIALTLVNEDVMLHNLAVVSPKSAQKVGEASLKMLNDPNVATLNYTPKMKDVRVVVPMIDLKEKVTVYFKAPKKKGDITHSFAPSQVTAK